MPTDFNITSTIDRPDSRVRAQQKAVYNWYETHHGDDDVVDIYSPEWQARISSWHAWCIKTLGTDHVHSETIKLREVPEELEFPSFFFEYPIATFSLWNVFQAFYELDRAVCGTSSEAESTLQRWQAMKPFEYLRSEDVQERWRTDLQHLDAAISKGDLSGENLKSRMYNILLAVERLENASASLEDDFRYNYDEAKSRDWMLDTITDAFDLRCSMIAQFIKQDEPVPSYETVISGEMTPPDHELRYHVKS